MAKRLSSTTFTPSAAATGLPAGSVTANASFASPPGRYVALSAAMLIRRSPAGCTNIARVSRKIWPSGMMR